MTLRLVAAERPPLHVTHIYPSGARTQHSGLHVKLSLSGSRSPAPVPAPRAAPAPTRAIAARVIAPVSAHAIRPPVPVSAHASAHAIAPEPAHAIVRAAARRPRPLPAPVPVPVSPVPVPLMYRACPCTLLSSQVDAVLVTARHRPEMWCAAAGRPSAAADGSMPDEGAISGDQSVVISRHGQ